jgi:hypothetical protein
MTKLNLKVQNNTIFLPPGIEIDDGEIISVLIPGQSQTLKFDTDELLDSLIVDSIHDPKLKEARGPRVAGSSKGLFTVPDDFDDPIDDFKEYM